MLMLDLASLSMQALAVYAEPTCAPSDRKVMIDLLWMARAAEFDEVNKDLAWEMGIITPPADAVLNVLVSLDKKCGQSK